MGGIGVTREGLKRGPNGLRKLRRRGEAGRMMEIARDMLGASVVRVSDGWQWKVGGRASVGWELCLYVSCLVFVEEGGKAVNYCLSRKERRSLNATMSVFTSSPSCSKRVYA